MLSQLVHRHQHRLGAAARGARTGPDVRPDERHQHGPRRVHHGRRLHRLRRAEGHLGRPAVSLLVALPVAFVVAGLIGVVLEITLIRRLYGRPLDTLLVTWGVALVLQQAARDIFGAPNVDVRAPDWLAGGGARSWASRVPATRDLHPRAVDPAASSRSTLVAASSPRSGAGSARSCRTGTWPRRSGIPTGRIDRTHVLHRVRARRRRRRRAHPARRRSARRSAPTTSSTPSSSSWSAASASSRAR